MIRIIGIAGSLRKGSFNAGLLRAASEVAPDGCTLETATIDDIPLYNADTEEQAGVPAAVAALKDRIAAADGLLLVTPEYNNSIPGVFKNAIDWLSRPPADRARVFSNRPTGLIGASPGPYGTAFSQTAWLPVLRALRLQIWTGNMLWVSSAGKRFDTQGNLADPSIHKRLAAYMRGLASFVSTHGAGQ